MTMPISPDLCGRVALVTGAARGIGKAIALALAEHGADVAVNYRERARDAEAAAAAARNLGRRAVVVGADVSDSTAVKGMIATVERELGPIDVLVNNAGIAIRRQLDELTEADFDRTIAVNLKSAFLCSQAVLPAMCSRRWGRIVNISSGAARGAGIVGAHYNASKAGMEGLTRGFAARLVKEGITVNAVAPTLIDTEMLPSAAEAAARVPMGRLGTSEEVAQVVLMVIGNPYMTGQTVQVNGGMHFN
jgi:3-oxoacyl-[acyl-carrier protein] reductase